jgi:hypothetical protein
MTFQAIADWQDNDHEIFDRAIFHRHHAFTQQLDVSDDGLAELIDKTPDDFIDVVTMGADKTDNASWRTGDVRGVPGKDVITAVREGRVWLNLRDLNQVMPQYREILQGIYNEFEDHIPGLKTRHQQIGFIISSPKVQTFYHIDVPSTVLWQLRGVKRVWAYPLEEPFISQHMLEGIYLNEIDEVDIPFEPSFDEGAVCIDLQPGELLTWAHNAPHRVQNHDMLNVSLSSEHFTLDSMKQYGVYFSNGYLSRRFGLGSMSTSTRGLSPWVKSAFTAGLKKSGLQKGHRREKIVSFRVDPSAPQGVRDIEPYRHGAFNTGA